MGDRHPRPHSVPLFLEAIPVKNTNVQPKTQTTPSKRIFKLDAKELKMIHGGKGAINE